MWPRWGQFYQTGGAAGELPAMPDARRLLDLYRAWRSAGSRNERTVIWQEMLEIWTEQTFTIGLVAGVLQPVVVHPELPHLPVQGVSVRESGAEGGIHHHPHLHTQKAY